MSGGPLFFLIFALSAALGAFFRYKLGLFIFAPWSTLFVNLLGSLLIGFFYVFLSRFSPLSIFVCVAFLGALTTYSSFALDMVKMLEEGSYGPLGLYFLLSNTGALVGCYIGFSIAKKMVTSL